MKNKLFYILPYMGIFFCSLVHSDGVILEKPKILWKPIIGVGGGVAITANLGQQQSFPIENPLTDERYDYLPGNKVQTQGLFEIFLGAEYSIHQNWRTQVGLAYNQTGTYNNAGLFVQGADPDSSQQYTYSYQVVLRELLAQTKLMYTYRDKFYPYVLLGLGGSFNKASLFSTNVPPFLTFSRDYANNTARSFAYKVGLGSDVDIMTNTRIGVAYRFSGFGAISLGSAHIDGSAVSGTLSQSNLYVNEVLIQLTYVI